MSKYESLVAALNAVKQNTPDNILSIRIEDRVEVFTKHNSVEEFAADFPNYILVPNTRPIFYSHIAFAAVGGVEFYTYINVKEDE